MTVHSAKGLEYTHVYIVGLEENLFPSLMSLGTNREIEEERSLFYVALTRAMESATLSYAENRYKWGNLESAKPSMFIEEIDKKYLNYPQTGGLPYSSKGKTRPGNRISPGRQYLSEKQAEFNPHGKKKLKEVSKSSPPKESFNYTSELDRITPGTIVSHERFGKGEVLIIEGEAPNTTAKVSFDSVVKRNCYSGLQSSG